MAKYRYNNISSIRTFAESPAKWFMCGNVKTPRKEIEKEPYYVLKQIIKNWKLQAIQRLG